MYNKNDETREHFSQNNGLWLGFAVTSAILIFAHDSTIELLFSTLKTMLLVLPGGLDVLTLLLLGFAGYLYHLRKNNVIYIHFKIKF